MAGFGCGGTPRRNGPMRCSRSHPRRPRGGSLPGGNAVNSFSLTGMAEPPFWLRGRWRVRDRVTGWPGRWSFRRARGVAVQPAWMDLAGERLTLVHAHVGVGHQRRQIVGIAAYDFPGKSPVERE